MPKMIKKRKDDGNQIKINFDVSMLNVMIRFARCDDVSGSDLGNLNKLMKEIDPEKYNYSEDIKDRILLLKGILSGVCEKGIKDDDLLMSYLSENIDGFTYLLSKINFDRNQLSQSDIAMVSKNIADRLQYLYVYQVKDEIVNELSSMDKAGFNSIQENVNILKGKLSALMVKLQTISSPDTLLREFRFSGEDFGPLITHVVNRSKKPSTILQTGIRHLNSLLSPGFQSGRLYTILGGTGRFKSGTLLNLTDQIRLFNPHIAPVENGKRKTILFVTMENTVQETIVRLFDMYNDTNLEMKDMSVEDVVKILREKGKFNFSDSEGIDIEFRYYSDLEIATSNLYTIVSELNNVGKEVIAIVLDYILKLNSDKEHHGDERLRISYAGRELKALAQFLDIPVITAMQINREGNSILEAGMQESKEDIGRFIGASYVGQCWDLIQESDWVAFINLEQQKSSGKIFLSMKRLKIRGKKDQLALEYFNHPFANSNNIRLEPDVDKPAPLSVISLSSDLISIDDRNGNIDRPKISDINKSKNRGCPISEELNLDGLVKIAA